MDTPNLGDSSKSAPDPGSGTVRKVVLSLVVVFVGVGAYFFFFQSPRRPTAKATVPLTAGSPEQAYAANLRLGNFAMKQAENFLNQEVKILEGDLLNAGGSTVVAVDATIEFRDSLDQIALSETRPLLPPSPAGLAPGQVRHFELSFDHVPVSWNYQMPKVTIVGLKLSDNKK
jgi:hypothetical protein